MRPKALITGSAGFIGTYLTEAFFQDGYEVHGVDIKCGHDVRDFVKEDDLPHYDVVIHAAAVVGGRRVMDWTPLRHTENFEIDSCMMRWAEKAQPGRFVYFSSSCAYPVDLAQNSHKMREEDIVHHSPMLPDQIYGWEKLTGEMMAGLLEATGVPVTVVRPFSVYGDGANEGFAVRGFLDQAKARAEPFIIWGDSSQQRDYIHAEDVANAILELVHNSADGAYNLGTGKSTSLQSLALMTCAAVGNYNPQIVVDKAMPAGVRYLVAETSRLQKHYTHKRSIDEYVKHAVQKR